MKHMLCTHMVAMEAMDATGIYSFSLEGKVLFSSNKNSNEQFLQAKLQFFIVIGIILDT